MCDPNASPPVRRRAWQSDSAATGDGALGSSSTSVDWDFGLLVTSIHSPFDVGVPEPWVSAGNSEAESAPAAMSTVPDGSTSLGATATVAVIWQCDLESPFSDPPAIRSVTLPPGRRPNCAKSWGGSHTVRAIVSMAKPAAIDPRACGFMRTINNWRALVMPRPSIGV